MHLQFAFSFILAAVVLASEPQNQHTLLLSKPETSVGTQEYDNEPSMVNVKSSHRILRSNKY
jgi:hypothetical protein